MRHPGADHGIPSLLPKEKLPTRAIDTDLILKSVPMIWFCVLRWREIELAKKVTDATPSAVPLTSIYQRRLASRTPVRTRTRTPTRARARAQWPGRRKERETAEGGGLRTGGGGLFIPRVSSALATVATVLGLGRLGPFRCPDQRVP